MKLPRDEKGRLLPRGGFSKQVSFRINDDLYQELSERASEKGLSVAEYTRDLITAIVKNQQAN
jgi:predicted HicB family RNase H-like nuclease